MVHSTYALRESTSKTNSLENRSTTNTSTASSSLYSSSLYYTEKDPQYYTSTLPKMSDSKKTNDSKSMSISKSSSNNKSKGRKRKPSTKKATATAVLASNASSTSAAAYASAPRQVSSTNREPARVRLPGRNDVLSGRGGNINNHFGNIQFRSFVEEEKKSYNLTTNKTVKSEISQSIIDKIHNLTPSGRFLKKDNSSTGNGMWVEVTEALALSKTSQALREGAPTIRAEAAEKKPGFRGTNKKKAKKRKRKSSYKQQSSTVSTSTRTRTRTVKKRPKYDDDEDYIDEESVYNESSDTAHQDDDRSQSSQETENMHPLIVPMTNGRGKQLIPRPCASPDSHRDPSPSPEVASVPVPVSAIQSEGKQEQVEEQGCSSSLSVSEFNSRMNKLLNPCVSFDEEHSPRSSTFASRGSISSSGSAVKFDSEAPTPPAALPFTSEQTMPPLSLDDTSIPYPVHESSGPNHNPSETSLASYSYNDPQSILPTLAPVQNMNRIHSLSSNLPNQDSFNGEESFVDPFTNEAVYPANVFNNGDMNENARMFVNPFTNEVENRENVFNNGDMNENATGASNGTMLYTSTTTADNHSTLDGGRNIDSSGHW
jgi:hypothetical protein